MADELHERFVRECQAGNLATLEDMLTMMQLDIHFGDEMGFCAACYTGQLGVVRLLLSLDGDRRVDVHAQREQGFVWACGQGHLEVAQLLLSLEGDRRIDVHSMEEAAFVDACRGGWHEVVQLLLSLTDDRRIDVHVMDNVALTSACRHGKLEVLRLLLALEGDRNMLRRNTAPLRQACTGGDPHVVRELLKVQGPHAMDVQLDRCAALRAAAGAGHGDIVGQLLRHPSAEGIQGGVLFSSLAPCLQKGYGGAAVQLLLAAPCFRPPQLPLNAVARRRLGLPGSRWGGAAERAGGVANSAVQHVMCHFLQPGTAPPLAAPGSAADQFDASLAACIVACCALRACGYGAEGRTLPAQLKAQLADIAWCGVCVPVAAIRGAPADAALGGLLRRSGRRGMLLHRAAARGAALP